MIKYCILRSDWCFLINYVHYWDFTGNPTQHKPLIFGDEQHAREVCAKCKAEWSMYDFIIVPVPQGNGFKGA